MNNQLAVLLKSSGLDTVKSAYMLEKFNDYFAIAEEWKSKATTIVVNDEAQKPEMEMARIGRLFLRDKRLAIEKTRKELKEQSLKEGQAIDSVAKVLKGLIEPIETYLEQQEKFVEFREKARLEKERVEAELRLQAELEAQEKAKQVEYERARIENEQLKKEAHEKDTAMQVERVKAFQKEQQAIIEKVKREAQEQLLQKQKAEADLKAKQQEMELAQVKRELVRLKRTCLQIVCPKCEFEFEWEE